MSGLWRAPAFSVSLKLAPHFSPRVVDCHQLLVHPESWLKCLCIVAMASSARLKSASVGFSPAFIAFRIFMMACNATTALIVTVPTSARVAGPKYFLVSMLTER